MRVGALFLVLGLLCQPPPTSPLIGEADDIAQSVLDMLVPLLGDVDEALQGFISIGKIGMGVAKFIDIIADQVFNASLEDMNFGSYIPMADRKILAMFELLSQRLDQMEHGVHGIANSLRDLAEGMQDMVRWEIALDTMEEYMRPIHTLYKRFLLYQTLKDQIEDHTLMDFANQVVSHDTHSIMSLMAHLHSMAVPDASLRSGSPLHDSTDPLSALNNPKDAYHIPEKVTRKIKIKEKRMKVSESNDDKLGQFLFRPSLFQMLHQALQSSDRCNFKQSPQQLVNGLHVLLALTEARGYAMLEFAWMVLRVYNEGNFTVEREVAKRLYNQYSEDMINEAHKVLVNEPRDFYRCDPRTYIDGDTHVQFTELLQGYVENEVDMNSDSSCKSKCSYYQHAKSEGCYLPGQQYCGKHRRCRGTIHDCKFYDADAHVCLSRNPYRRYDYIKYESGLRLGHQDSCSGTTMKVDSWWRWFVHCSYCLCLCDDASSATTDRFISLMPAYSDTRNNMIVTGMKFTKQQRVLHVQIQQGQALPQGQVNTSSIRWVDVEPINFISTAYQEGIHIKTLSYEDRNIDLDQLEAPEEHVVTGVKFRMLGSHINLEVQVTPINYTTGELQPFKSYWISNDNTPAMAKNPRQQIKVDDLDDPTKFPALNKQDSKSDTWLRFGPTSRGADVAQLTIPFFDAQSTSPFPSSWLSGVEIYHKGQPGSGGFIGLKVSTYDITQHMETSSSEMIEKRRMKYLTSPISEEEKLGNDIEEMVNEEQEGLGVLKYMKHIYDGISISLMKNMLNKRITKETERKILREFQRLSKQLDQLEQKTNEARSSLQRLANEMRNVIRWELALDTLEECTRAINIKYDQFLLYQSLQEKVENQTLLEFIEQMVSHDRFSILSLMGDLHSIAAPQTTNKFEMELVDGIPLSHTIQGSTEMKLISKQLKAINNQTKKLTQERTTFRSSLFKLLSDTMEQTNPCLLKQSPQQLLKGLYLMFAVTQARGFVMLEFSWIMLRYYGEGNYTTEQDISEYIYVKYSKDILSEAQRVMAGTSRDFYKCDPHEHEEGKTYIEFTELLQGYLENEVNFNHDGSCKQNCAYYQNTNQKSCFQKDSQLCGQQAKCQGTLRDCKFHEPDAWVCLSANKHRKYDYIRYESGLQLGYDGVCNGTGKKVDSWYRWFYHCSYCLCICDNEELKSSDRFVSLNEVVSDAENDMVVTGLKLLKDKQVIHLVIQQGQTLPKGAIDASTIEWMAVKPIDIGRPPFEENNYYHRLSYDQRSINLDRREGPSNHVVTGVRFGLDDTHINLQVRLTPVDFESGILNPSKSYWLEENNPDKQSSRQEIKLHNPCDPTKVSNPHLESSNPNTYIKFGPTSRSSDVSQLTVPFFDAQEISPSPSVWLSGIDLYHRGQSGSGGFLGFKLITYDISNQRF